MFSKCLTQVNNNFRSPTVVNRLTTRNLNSIESSNTFTKMYDALIAKGIESYIRSASDMEKELLKYLNYYFKKYNGNIAIPIKNIMDNFASKGYGCSARWIQKLLRRIYDLGWVVTTGGGYGRKVTRRTLTERGMMIIKAITKGFGAIKQDIPQNSADYCADYSRDHSIYISSEADILKNKSVEKPFEKTPETEKHAKTMLEFARKALKT